MTLLLAFCQAQVFISEYIEGPSSSTTNEIYNGWSGDVSSIAFFNGDDAVVLRQDGIIVDAIGEVGVDPGSAWPKPLADILRQV